MQVIIAGVDEVGRSSLAGPIVAAAVAYEKRPLELRGIKESKRTKRTGGLRKLEQWFYKITRTALSWSVGHAPPHVVEEVGVHYASLCAMKKALEQLKPSPGYVFVDGKYIIPGCSSMIQLAQPKSDENIWIVAAASIVAKFIRDTLMIDLHNCTPGLFPYRFDQNVGYRSPEHLLALREFGVTNFHRHTFSDVIREGECFMGENPSMWRKSLQEREKAPVLQRLEAEGD